MTKPGTPAWGEMLKQTVCDGCGVQITQNIVVVRNAKHNGVWYLEIGDTRTGKSIEIRVTASGRKVECLGERQ